MSLNRRLLADVTFATVLAGVLWFVAGAIIIVWGVILGKRKAPAEASSSVVSFPPVTDLAAYHELIDMAYAAVGEDMNNPPTGMAVLVLRDGELEQFALAPGTALLTLIGAVEVQRITLMESLLYRHDE